MTSEMWLGLVGLLLTPVPIMLALEVYRDVSSG